MHHLNGQLLQPHNKTSATHRVQIIAACPHARTPAVPSSALSLHGCVKPLKNVNNSKGIVFNTRRVRGRLLHSSICASMQGDSSPGPQFASFPSSYTPFSAELLLAVARLGHLERYRQEIAQFYEPGDAADLTRCGLLISNVFSPQLDHRPYYEKLEEYIGRATLAALANFDDAEALWDMVLGVPESSASSSSTHTAARQDMHRDTILPVSTAPAASGSSQPSSVSDMHLEGFSGLDMMQPDHLLRAIAAINQVLFLEERLTLNTADPYDPLNGSIADVIDAKQGNQYSLALIYLHVAEGLGLPCMVVGSPEHILLRIGLPTSNSSTSSDTVTANFPGTACFLVDVANGGEVYAWPGKIHSSSLTESSHGHASSPSTPSAADSTVATAAVPHPMDVASADDISDEWQKTVQTWLQLRADAYNPVADRQNEGPHAGLNLDARHPIDEGSVLSDATDSDSSDIYRSLTDWQQAGRYSAVDAATRNSWKALYGPGALTEWGGLVSSSSSSANDHPPYTQSGIHDDGNDNICDSNELRGATAAAGNTWFGVLDTPFATAAVSPLPGNTQYGDDLAAGQGSSSSSTNDNAGSSTVIDSMDTFCGSDTEDSRQQGQEAPCIVANSTSTGSSGGHLVPTVSCLSEQDVQVKYGGLAPVRARVLLQQLLAGMKLSLLMSGREEEALAVIRYLRATDPFSLPDLRDEALALANAADYSNAAQLLREYLAVAPGAADADMVDEVLQQVQLAAEVARARARKQRWD